MQTVNIHEAKTHLSRLLESVEQGEEIVIARAGQPVALLTAYREPRRKIAPPGSMKGQDWWMSDEFDEPIDDLFDCLKDNDEVEGFDGTSPP
jgi:prevent-host-death family protein